MTPLRQVLRRFGGGGAPRVLVLVDLVQDLEVLAPVILGIAAEPSLRLEVVVSGWLQRQQLAVEAFVRRHGLPHRFVPRRRIVEGRAPDLRGVAAVLTASESSHPAHAAGHALANRATAAGVAAYTLQHGLENVGLLGPEAADWTIASPRIFCWFPPALAGEVAEPARSRLIHVGRPRRSPPPAGPAEFAVAVFENLHADRYTDAERERFAAGLQALAADRPVLLRTHPAGRWSDTLDMANVTLDDSPDAVTAIARAERVITTPSTVALDAAQQGRAVALALPGGALFDPLPLLDSADAWRGFASQASDPEPAQAFLRRVLQPGDAVAAVLETLRRDLTGGLAPDEKV